MVVHPGEPWIVYQTDIGAGNVIFLMRSDASDAHAISASAAGEQLHPDWSPDGRRIAFVGDGGLWVADGDGSNAQRLKACDSCDYPAWSPGGTKIAFSRYETGATGPSASSIEVFDLASSAVTTVVREERPHLVDVPRWSPDGQQLVVGVDQMDESGSETGAAIAVVSASGGTLRNLTTFDSFASYPDWSWVSNTIVYSTEAIGAKKTPGPGDDTWDLHTIKPDGTALRQITHVAQGTQIWQPSWTPDGKRVIADLEQDRRGVFVDPVTGQVDVIASPGAAVTHPRLRPTP